MNDYSMFTALSPTAFADILPLDQVLDHAIRPLWQPMPRIAGPAYTVRCAPGDNLMLHAAIYRAQPGSIIVVAAGDAAYAVSGGNVCAIAQQRGIAGFIVDGVVRDLREIRESRFPVFARGISPKPGGKNGPGSLNEPVTCGTVQVCPGDVVVADEEGIIIVPRDTREEIVQAAAAKAARDEATPLDKWAAAHRTKIEQLLAERGIVL